MRGYKSFGITDFGRGLVPRWMLCREFWHWVRAAGLALAAACSPAGPSPWQNKEVSVAGTVGWVELKIAKR